MNLEYYYTSENPIDLTQCSHIRFPGRVDRMWIKDGKLYASCGAQVFEIQDFPKRKIFAKRRLALPQKSCKHPILGD